MFTTRFSTVHAVVWCFAELYMQMALSVIANLVNSLECCVYSVSNINLAEQTECLSPPNCSVFCWMLSEVTHTILSELGLPKHYKVVYGQTSGDSLRPDSLIDFGAI